MEGLLLPDCPLGTEELASLADLVRESRVAIDQHHKLLKDQIWKKISDDLEVNNI